MLMPRILPRPLRRGVPNGLPFLSAGKHARPGQGACLMEYVSLLAGRRFSAKPACTDRTLAAIARAVNDYSTEAGRQQLTRYAGTLTTASGLDVGDQRDLARRVLLTAIPYVTGSRRHTLVVALLGMERAAAGQTHGFDDHSVGLDTELALLDGGEGDIERARHTLAEYPVTVRQNHKKGVATAVEFAVASIASEAADPDAVLFGLLGACLEDHQRVQSVAPVARSRRALPRQRSRVG